MAKGVRKGREGPYLHTIQNFPCITLRIFACIFLWTLAVLHLLLFIQEISRNLDASALRNSLTHALK
jgi:hypothetical protein